MATYTMKTGTNILCFFMCVFLTVCWGDFLTDKCSDKIPGCYCTDSYIDCNGAELVDLSEIYPYITNQTHRINIVNGKIRSIPDNAFTGSLLQGPLKEMKYLNLSDNSIETIYNAAFTQLPNLETLDLSDNEVLIDSCDDYSDLANSFDSLTMIKTLRLRNFISRETTGQCGPGFMFKSVSMHQLISLDVSSNGFNVIGDDMENFLCETYTLTSLNLSNNQFETYPVPMCMSNLKSLDLTNNNIATISHLDTELMNHLANLNSLKLGGNPFNCDCYLFDLLVWLNTTEQTLDTDDMICATSDNASLIGTPVKDLDPITFCQPNIAICVFPGTAPIHVAKSTFITILAVMVVVVVIVVTAFTVFVCRRRHLRRQQQSAAAPSDSQMTADVSKSTLYSRMV